MKNLGIMFILLVLVLGCIGQEEVVTEPEPEYTLDVTGLAQGTITVADLRETPSEFTAILVKSTGTEIENTWKGRLLTELLAQYNVNPEYISFVAEDGYMITLQMEDLKNAYLCYEMDGKQLALEDGGPVRLVITDQPGKLWMSYLKEIKLIGKENALIIHGKTKVVLALTKEDFARFDKKTMEAEFKGEMKTYEGISLTVLLNQARYEDDATSIKFVASDGYTIELDFAEVYGNEDILVTEDFTLVMPGYESKYWMKGLAEIEVL
ncbi:MAG: molybdopterin-dependent oxidoreductase [Theionarchaea archaeon]|nr:molybdopterin-dependent oxidoreductase [Theionarchaea archaeon]MBU6999807.1 molybdopterin-dependent oxidoreductase [Theionarchaea archaeon]MBU7020227.1 molybdopterin-dependent oxidoreductase [Theionarchaea archaeon]MBU7033654.1 molybdopterin-dependent oxidoreductase [Theionarchaea archaeon]MBU7040093.1 molybdopterin-dependent oxidoreductase [Theionarchaea archaeon]